MEEKLSFKNVEEKELNPMSGGLMLFINILMYIVSIASLVLGIVSSEKYDNDVLCGVLVAAFVILLTGAIIVSCGFKIINPNEELVLTFFGSVDS